MGAIINLEPLCAEYGMEIVNRTQKKVTDKENLINKALGVLVENGIYAMHIFLLSYKDKEFNYGEEVFDIMQQLLIHPDLNLLQKKGKRTDGLKNVRELTRDIPKMILARKVLEQTLTFARYHCKALNEKENA